MEFVGQGIATLGIWIVTAVILVFLNRAQASVIKAAIESGHKNLSSSVFLDLCVLGAAVIATALVWS